jgi:murein DD-endopeptidase MepM/ murein hydrolase activator NlpD
MVSKDGNLSIKSVKDGKLFRGSIKCGSGLLRYVRVDHGEGLNTYYLHVNY